MYTLGQALEGCPETRRERIGCTDAPSCASVSTLKLRVDALPRPDAPEAESAAESVNRGSREPPRVFPRGSVQPLLERPHRAPVPSRSRSIASL